MVAVWTSPLTLCIIQGIQLVGMQSVPLTALTWFFFTMAHGESPQLSCVGPDYRVFSVFTAWW